MTDLQTRPEPSLEERKQRTEELKALGFDPKNAAHRVAVKVAEELGLNLLLKELIVIPGKGAYITRDGLLAVAHRSEQLDGIVVEDEAEDGTHWTARVSVYRKDMAHPFTYRGRYPKQGDNRKYGPEMAVKCAEVMALRRAFRVTGIATLEESWERAPVEHDAEPDVEPDDGES